MSEIEMTSLNGDWKGELNVKLALIYEAPENDRTRGITSRIRNIIVYSSVGVNLLTVVSFCV
jgi:hypothetical protein